MDFIVVGGEHEEHDARWVLYSLNTGCAVCLGCVTEILENDQVLTIKKKPALAELLRFLTQQPQDILQLFMQEEQVVWHLLTILLDMLKVDDESVVALTIETILMVMKRVESEDLVTGILDSISKQVAMETNRTSLLPQYTLLGKMLYQLPPLPVKLSQDYEPLLNHLGASLNSEGEIIQSALSYIFIFLCDGQYERLLSPRLRQQLYHGMITMLNTAQSQPVQINALEIRNRKILDEYQSLKPVDCVTVMLVVGRTPGLLKKLVGSEEGCQVLMSLSRDGVTLLSAMKKLLLSKKDVLKIGIAQILSLLLSRRAGQQYAVAILESDLVEFLFEALHSQNTVQLECVLATLCQLSKIEEFYKRCHAVYGIESILTAISTAFELKNPTLLKHGFAVLAEVLQRQPLDIPLFVGVGVVKKCLAAVRQGASHHHLTVNTLAVQAAAAIVRKEHLMIPIPFPELSDMIRAVTGKVWGQLRVPKQPKHKSTDTPGSGLLSPFIDMVLRSCQLLKVCKSDPAACQSNFTAPSIASTDGFTQLTEFANLLIQICDESCLPLVMIYWEVLGSPDVYRRALEILCCLPEVDGPASRDIILRLVEAGFLSTLLEAKVDFNSNPDIQESIGRFLWLACDLELQREGQGYQRLDEDQFLTGVKDAKWKFSEAVVGFSDSVVSVEAVQVYIHLIFLSFQYGNRVMSAEDLQCLLSAVLERHTSLEQLPPLIRKRFLYLLATVSLTTGADLRECMPNSSQSVISMVNSSPVDTWYVHNITLLHWCFLDPILTAICGHKVLGAWLAATTVSDLEEDQCDPEPANQSESRGGLQAVLPLCQRESFLYALITSMATESVDNVCKLSTILDCHLTSPPLYSQTEVSQTTNQHDMTESSENEPRNKVGYIAAKCTEVLQSVFLKNYSRGHDHNIAALLGLLLSVVKSASTVIDVKILYHVMNLLGKKWEKSAALEKSCLALLLVATAREGTGSQESQVVQMLVQNAPLMTYLETCIRDTTVSYAAACQIVSSLVSQVSSKTRVSCPVSVEVRQLVHSVVSRDLDIRTSCLLLLGALFHVQLSSPAVKLTGSITSNDFQSLYIYIQQQVVELSLEEGSHQNWAVYCMEGLFHYLLEKQPALGNELLGNPWNCTLIQFLVGLSEETSKLSATTVSVFHLFLGIPAGLAVVRSCAGLLPSLASCVLTVSSTHQTDRKHLKELAAQILKAEGSSPGSVLSQQKADLQRLVKESSV